MSRSLAQTTGLGQPPRLDCANTPKSKSNRTLFKAERSNLGSTLSSEVSVSRSGLCFALVLVGCLLAFLWQATNGRPRKTIRQRTIALAILQSLSAPRSGRARSGLARDEYVPKNLVVRLSAVAALQEGSPARFEHTPTQGVCQSSVHSIGQEAPSEGANTWRDQTSGELDAVLPDHQQRSNSQAEASKLCPQACGAAEVMHRSPAALRSATGATSHNRWSALRSSPHGPVIRSSI